MKLISNRRIINRIPTKLSFPIGRTLLHMKKQSPHIFFAVGVVGAITSTVLACRATLKLGDTLDEVQKNIDEAKALKEQFNELKAKTTLKDYPAIEDYEKDMTYVYVHGTVRIIRLYGPAVIIGVASIACLTGSHVQLTRRNSALLAAYATLQQAFDEYRERVRKEVGKESEQDLYNGVKTKTIVGDDGEEKKVKTPNPNQYSVYAKFFDEASSHWQKDPELNRLYVQCQQKYANDLLRSRGHVFLNEVYDMLDVERSRAGAVVGWVWNGDGDNYVSFGMFSEEGSRFINGTERSILLDFNVDGVIYDKI